MGSQTRQRAGPAPGSGHSIHLPAFDGVIYYTVEPSGYRAVATLASGVNELPIRSFSPSGSLENFRTWNGTRLHC